jgi:hypothetical protein
MFKSISFILAILFTSQIVHAIELDSLGSLGEGVYSKSLTCGSSKVSFTRKKNQPPLFLINDKKVPLEQTCYGSLDCVNFKGQDTLLLVVTPACGGNGIPESYVTYDLNTLKKKEYNYNTAKKAKLIN